MKNASLILALFLGACTTSGVKVDQHKLDQFQQGRSTYQNVIGELGTPTQELVSSSGERTAIYSYMSAQARPESFIPIVGLMVGGADVENSSTIFTFDERGVLKNYTRSSGAIGGAHGLQAIPTKRNEQPRIAR